MYEKKIESQQDYDTGFDAGYLEGLEKGREVGYEEAYDDAYKDIEHVYEDRIKHLYVELMEMEARIAVLERRM